MDAVLLAVAFFFGLLAQQLRLPPLVGFLVSGFVLQAFGQTGGSALKVIADLGVTLMLFSIGVKLRVRTLARPEIWAGTSLHTLVQMVDNGLGLTMLPEMALDAGILNGTNVVARPLKSDNANREIALVWRKNSPRGDEFRLLAEELRTG